MNRRQHEQDEVHAFSCSLHFGSVYHYLFCGIDYEQNRKGEFYFNMMYHMVEDAIRQGKSTACVGQNADECKHQKLGTHQVPRVFYIKGANWLSRTSLNLFGKLLFPERTLVYPRCEISTDAESESRDALQNRPEESDVLDPAGASASR
ncbi:MAG: GNAT family N-acetyltransferase [Planctomycetota bacterium]|nr:GNAT family N-acetyltransferase [Planctomycetota bacterium]MDA1214489.1 GNAT family N-acetyltransferase [Planctomycetota bacterium]